MLVFYWTPDGHTTTSLSLSLILILARKIGLAWLGVVSLPCTRRSSSQNGSWIGEWATPTATGAKTELSKNLKMFNDFV